tara:strand:+ start:5062 stop:6636 length:1575 start_codon:yes stop_codon:yes gene_type:complete
LKTIIISLLCLISTVTSLAQTPIFSKIYYDTVNLGDIKDIITTRNNDGYVILGHNNINTDFHVFKINDVGDVQWTVRVAFSDIIYIKGLAESADGSLFVEASSTISGKTVLILAKITSTGTVSWVNKYEETLSVNASHLSINNNDEIVILCEMSGDNFVLKVDTNGNAIWSKRVGIWVERGYGQKILHDDDDNIFIASRAVINSGDPSGVRLTKLDTGGNYIWSKTYEVGVAGDDFLTIDDFVLDNDQLLVTGYTRTTNYIYDIYLFKSDTSGVINLGKRYSSSNSDYVSSIAVMGNGNYILGGNTLINTAYNHDQFVMKIDATGSIQDSYFFHEQANGGAGFDATGKLIKDLDGGLMMGGGYGWGMHVYKTSLTGDLPCNDYFPLPFTESSFPYLLDLTYTAVKSLPSTFTKSIMSPTITTYTETIDSKCDSLITDIKGNSTIESMDNIKMHLSQDFQTLKISEIDNYNLLTITAMDGRTIIKESMQNSGGHIINISGFTSGIYVLTLSNTFEIHSQKFVINR